MENNGIFSPKKRQFTPKNKRKMETRKQDAEKSHGNKLSTLTNSFHHLFYNLSTTTSLHDLTTQNPKMLLNIILTANDLRTLYTALSLINWCDLMKALLNLFVESAANDQATYNKWNNMSDVNRTATSEQGWRRKEPWGTPHVTFKKEDLVSPILVNWNLLSK